MKNLVVSFVISLVVFSSININAQKAQKNDSIKYTAVNKGKIFVSWGGNRGQFTNSDITFKGDDYDFKLYDVESHDKPKGWHIDYINPANMTIPQTNFKLGYFVSEKYTVSLGLDHMKYVMTQNQTVNIDGEINGPIHNGVYDNVPIQLTEDFLTFEHTDGLNYIYAEFARYDDISSIFGIHNTDKFQINITEGVAGGALLPKTNSMLLSKDRYDEFHLAGFGFSLHAGLNVTFFKHFVIQGNLKGGYINMGDIRTTNDSADSASQDFFYLQEAIALGWIFRI
ncbi:MAG: hypothetical protein KAH07_02160 [Flavobacteriaceae bacterium]|nr:hypothetical protein [Flavobacteriaceae bacterium]